MTQSERGEYRSIRQVLLDGPDFQKLSERARFAFLVIKIGSGPTGLELEYAIALAEKVANRTGMGVRAAKKASEELRNSGWVEREGNVLWIKGHPGQRAEHAADRSEAPDEHSTVCGWPATT